MKQERTSNEHVGGTELEKLISNNQVHFLFDVERKESVLFKVLKKL